MKQSQFLEVVDRDEAERRWREVIDVDRLGTETVPLERALGRVLGEDVRSSVDVPGFDRSNMDGFAVRAADTYGASEEEPVTLRLNAETIPTGVRPQEEVVAGSATMIATGGMLPRGADAVVPVEHTDLEDAVAGDQGRVVMVRHSRVPGAAVSFAGTDMGCGETELFSGTKLTSRETGLLAACLETVLERCAEEGLSRLAPRITDAALEDLLEPIQPGHWRRAVARDRGRYHVLEIETASAAEVFDRKTWVANVQGGQWNPDWAV